MQISKRFAQDEQFTSSKPKTVTTTQPYFTPEERSEASTEFDPFYSDCDARKSCFGIPAGCIGTKNCKAAMAVSVFGERFEFEMKATGMASWVGVGLSEDTFMGDDSVIECVKEGGNVKAYMSWTTPRPNLGVNRLSKVKNKF